MMTQESGDVNCASATRRRIQAKDGLRSGDGVSGTAIVEMAEGVGFEPTARPRRTTVFKTAAFNRSATPPPPILAAFLVAAFAIARLAPTHFTAGSSSRYGDA